jgi:hypothetical protein
VANVKHYQTNELTVPAGAVDGFGMSCPAGEGIVSGGGFASIANIAADHVAGNGWIFLVWNDTSIAVDIQGYITCAPGVAVGAVEHAVSTTQDLKLERNRVAKALN